MNFSEGFGEKTIFLVVKKISKSFIQGRGGGGVGVGVYLNGILIYI